jgi:hypothetical protein
MKYTYLSLPCLVLFLNYCNSKPKEDNSSLLTLLALSSSGASSSAASACTTPTPTCSGTKTFQNITQNSTHSTCTSCHASTSGFGNFDFTTYSNAITRINTASPKDSILWQKVASCSSSVGTMKVHSNSTFNDLIYCWIASGGTQ